MNRPTWQSLVHRMQDRRRNYNIAKMVSSFLSLRYPISPPIQPAAAAGVLAALSARVEAKEEGLASQMCQLIVTVCIKQQPEFNSGDLERILSFILAFCGRFSHAHSKLAKDKGDGSASTHTNDSEISTTMLTMGLRALGYIVSENVTKIVKFHQRLVDFLIPLCDDTLPLSIRRKAIATLGNFCMKGGNALSSFYGRISEKILAAFHECADRAHVEASYVKFLLVTLRALQVLTHESSSSVVPSLGIIMKPLRRFCFFGTPQFPVSVNVNVNVKSSVYPRTPKAGDPLEGPDSSSDSELDGESRLRKGKREKDGDRARDRESDRESDFEGDGEGSREISDYGRVRIAALTVIQYLSKAPAQRMGPGASFSFSRALQEYWKLFLPDSSSPASSSPPSEWNWRKDAHAETTLFTLLIHDEDAKVRTAAASTLVSLIDGSSRFLASAQKSDRRSFTSLSATLAAYIQQSHSGVICSLRHEKDQNVLVNVLKFLTVLISNAPYHNLDVGIVSSTINEVLAHILSKAGSANSDEMDNDNVKSAGLRCISAALSTSVALKEMEEMLDQFLMKQILELIDNRGGNEEKEKEKDGSIKREALRVLASAAGLYPKSVWSMWNEVNKTLLNVIDGGGDDAALVLRVLEEGTKRPFDFSLTTEDVGVDVGGGGGEGNGNEEQYEWTWGELLDTYIQPCLCSDVPVVRAAALDVIANIPSSVLCNLEDRHRLLCITSTLSSSENSDEASSVRGAAVRTLGVMVFAPVFRLDLQVLEDIANALEVCLLDREKKVNMPTKIRACWSLANTCHAMLESKARSEADDETESNVRVALLIRLSKLALSTAFSSDKLRANGVRALGCTLAAAPASSFDLNLPEWSVWSEAISALVRCVQNGPPKIRWNACYGLGLALGNDGLPQESVSIILKKLSGAVVEAQNYKVRIKAAQALGSCPKRYDESDDHDLDHDESKHKHVTDDVFYDVFGALIGGMDLVHGTTDASMFRYRDALSMEIRRAVAHILTLSQDKDVLTETRYKELFVAHKEELYKMLNHDDPGLDDGMKAFLHLCDVMKEPWVAEEFDGQGVP